MKLFGTQLCVVYVAMPASTGKQRAVFGSKQPGWFKDREFRRQTQKKSQAKSKRTNRKTVLFKGSHLQSDGTRKAIKYIEMNV